jgi:hypothetical protein
MAVEGRYSFEVKGKMTGIPIVIRACRLIARTERITTRRNI